MIYIKIITMGVLLLLISPKIKSQQKDSIPNLEAHYAKCDSIIKHTDFFTINYKYLDDEYNIIIDSVIFEKAIKTYGFYPERIKDHSDSLSIVMMAEFNDWDMARIAKLTISYTWIRLGYHTWQSQEEAKEFAMKFGINHPYKMKEFLINENNNDPEIIAFFNELKTKVKSQKTQTNIDVLDRDKLLIAALRCNPQHIADYQKMVTERRKEREAYLKEHGDVDPSKLGVGCGKKNCCQHKKQ